MPPEPSTAVPPPAPSTLRRLPGRSPSLRSRYGARATLWLDGTQLLHETVRSYTQEVQRFALADLQAVQIRRTVRGLVYNAILLACLALPLIGLVSELVSERPSTGNLIGLGITVGVFALLLLINTLRGPTCRTVLTTALGPQHLPSLSRVRVARRVLNAITDKVDAVQGTWQPDEAARQVDLAQIPRPRVAPAPGATLPGYDY